MDHVRELRRGEDVGQVDEGSRDGRDGDAVLVRHVALVEVAARLEAEVVARAPVPGHEDKDVVGSPARDTPERGRAHARESRTLACREYRGHPQPALV